MLQAPAAEWSCTTSPALLRCACLGRGTNHPSVPLMSGCPGSELSIPHSVWWRRSPAERGAKVLQCRGLGFLSSSDVCAGGWIREVFVLLFCRVLVNSWQQLHDYNPAETCGWIPVRLVSLHVPSSRDESGLQQRSLPEPCIQSAAGVS